MESTIKKPMHIIEPPKGFNPPQADLEAKERTFVNRLMQKGLITEVPARLPDDELRRSYKRVEVKGEPISETIIRERG